MLGFVCMQLELSHAFSWHGYRFCMSCQDESETCTSILLYSPRISGLLHTPDSAILKGLSTCQVINEILHTYLHFISNISGVHIRNGEGGGGGGGGGGEGG